MFENMKPTFGIVFVKQDDLSYQSPNGLKTNLVQDPVFIGGEITHVSEEKSSASLFEEMRPSSFRKEYKVGDRVFFLRPDAVEIGVKEKRMMIETKLIKAYI